MLEFVTVSDIGCAGFNRQSKETPTMKWERPDFIEIAMNAEIGGYQSDFDQENPVGPRGPVLEAESADAQSSDARAS